MALHLHPWNHSPLPVEVISLGVDANDPPDFLDALQREDWHNAAALQRELLKVAGWPDCRQAYRDNLAEARSVAGIGTGCDPASRRRKLEEAKRKVAYRKRLLAELDEKVKA